MQDSVNTHGGFERQQSSVGYSVYAGRLTRKSQLFSIARVGVASGLLIVLLVSNGCVSFQKPSWNKPWGRGTVIPAVVCGLVGAGTGALIQEVRTGESTATCTPADACPEGRMTITIEDDPEHYKGALIGAAIGTVVCAALGHVFLDPGPEPPEPVPTPPPVGEPGAPGGVEVREKKRIVLRGVYFDFDRSDIRPDSYPVLDEAARILAETPDIDLVVIEGHTDALGTEEYNQALSIRRAESVFRYLVNQGAPPERMRMEGHGESRPVADNETEEGRAQNRRVELRVVQ